MFIEFEDKFINTDQIVYITEIENDNNTYKFEIRFSNQCMPIIIEYRDRDNILLKKRELLSKIKY
jgi:hypothetical protein